MFAYRPHISIHSACKILQFRAPTKFRTASRHFASLPLTTRPNVNMSSLYDQSIPAMIKSLKSVSKILDKSVKYADENGIKHEELLTFRLRDDMRPLPYQIQSMSNTAKFFCVRVLKFENTPLTDEEATFAELQDRIKLTIELLSSVPKPSEVEGQKLAESEVIMETKVGNFRFESGQTYLSEFALPNFHFHMSTAYCILRHLGVPIDAMDYLGDVFHKV